MRDFRVSRLILALALVLVLVVACAPTPAPTLEPPTEEPAAPTEPPPTEPPPEPTETLAATEPAPPPVGELFPPEMPSAVRGDEVYRLHCTSCHGGAGDAGRGGAADFTDLEFMRGKKPAELFVSIRDGVEGTNMPGWGEAARIEPLTEMEIWDVLYHTWTFATTPEEVAQGMTLYGIYCAGCHGEAGDGSGHAGAADFTDQSFMASKDQTEFFVAIRDGVEGTDMPARGGTLSEDRIWALVNYVWTFAYDYGQELEEPTVAEKAQLVIAYDSDIDHIEPMQFRSLGAYDATANLYEPLIAQKLVPGEEGEFIGTNEFEGAVAESFEVSEDGTVFTFYLREDAKFADGTPITAHDYKYTFDRAMQGPGYIGLLTPLMALESPDDVVVVDDYTLQVTTSRPAALTETIIAFQVFGAISKATADAHATADDPWADEWHHTNSNSSGPYSITEWKPGTEYLFEPNPNYWRGSDWFQNSGVVFRVVPDASTRQQLLRAGDVDVALGMPFSDLDDLASDPNITIHAIPTTRLYHLGMNLNSPPFDDKRVRQAVSMAIPYQAIFENVIYGYGLLPTSPIPEGMEGHTDEFYTYDEVDLDEARALLADAGYADGFEVELTVPQEDQTRVDAATWAQAGLAEIGIDVTINAVPTAEFSELINSHELPFFIQEWYSWGNDPFYQLTWNFKCGSFPNFVNFCSEELDQIIEQGTFSRDPDERAELARRAQEILADEAVWAYLYQPAWIVATRSDVSGIALFHDLTLRYGFLGKE